ncbi:MAG TPA: hypothetical protein DIC35_02040 [Candidatus Moranbacteria bacterium]|nr:hypothetical protein [Candidatus Moranbacteria bacterium]
MKTEKKPQQHHLDGSKMLPPGFTQGYAEHRRLHNLEIGQVCGNSACKHCLAYQAFARKQNV